MGGGGGAVKADDVDDEAVWFSGELAGFWSSAVAVDVFLRRRFLDAFFFADGGGGALLSSSLAVWWLSFQSAPPRGGATNAWSAHVEADDGRPLPPTLLLPLAAAAAAAAASRVVVVFLRPRTMVANNAGTASEWVVSSG